MKSLFLRVLWLIGIIWMPISILFAQQTYQITPEIEMTVEPNRYVLHFVLPEYWLEEDDGHDYENEYNYGEVDSCDVFTNIEMNTDYDVTDEPGYPELPFFSVDLLLPSEISNIQTTADYGRVVEELIPSFIQPAQAGGFFTPEGTYVNFDEECYYNDEYYTSNVDANYPVGFCRNFYSCTAPYNIYSNKGITLSIFPFKYFPADGYMEVLLEAEFVIEFEGENMLDVIDERLSSTSYASNISKLYFDTFNDMSPSYNSTDNNQTLLIIAADSDMDSTLTSYVQYRQSQGMNVEILYLDDYSAIGNATIIHNLISTHNADYVLLVGTLNQIPSHYDGALLYDGIPTDDPYHPHIGRWVVNGDNGVYPKLSTIINKIIETENSFLGNPVLFSGTDSKKRVSKQFYRNAKVIQDIFTSMGMSSTLYDGRSFNNIFFARDSIVQSLRNNPQFFIYRGHGNDQMLGDPFLFSSTDIASIHDTTLWAMGFGFACSLNDYTVSNNFGSTWVSSSAGGVSFYGSTKNSYRASNQCLSKKIFKYYKKLSNKTDNFSLGVWLHMAEQSYYHAFPTFIRENQILKYNLVGDPSMPVYGPSNPWLSPRKEEMKQEFVGEFPCKEVKRIMIYDVSGRTLKIVDDKQQQEIQHLPNGVYFLQTIYENDDVKTSKFIKL